ncbi:MAG: hypothetical protein AB7P69_27060 [Candidatus Binatia bacterium]
MPLGSGWFAAVRHCKRTFYGRRVILAAKVSVDPSDDGVLAVDNGTDGLSAQSDPARTVARALTEPPRRPLRLIQPNTALAEKLECLGCEHERRLGIRMVLCRLHVTAGDKPLQVFLIAVRLGRFKLSDVTKQRYLGVR